MNRKGPLGVREQIKRQIKGLIESGSLKAGASLPSSRDLALTLGVNRNTTWAVYRELTEEGWLSSSVGSGTYVKAVKTLENREDMNALFDEIMLRAEKMGYDRVETADRFLNYLAGTPQSTQGRKVMVVECNRETADHLARSLERVLKVDTAVTLIQEIEENPERTLESLKGMDLVVCGFNHLGEFKKALPKSPVQAVGLLMAPDVKAMEILDRLPAGTSVGLTCANQRSTESLFKEVIYDSGSSLKRIWVGMDDEDGIREMLKECRMVLASHYVYSRVKSLASPETKVIRVALKPEPAGMTMVRECLS